MAFEWDDRKAATNRRKHGVEFAAAQLAFDDPHALVSEDVRHSTARERRRWLIGDSGAVLLVVIYTERGPNQFRLISARRAGRRDRRKYGAYKRDAVSLEAGTERDG